jgi:hypothetical protein
MASSKLRSLALFSSPLTLLLAACATSGSDATWSDPSSIPAATLPDGAPGTQAGDTSEGGEPAPLEDGGVEANAPNPFDDSGVRPPNDDAAPPPMTMPSFLIGYNEGWFADNYGTDYTTAFNLAYVNKTLDGIVSAGGHVVRLFLFEAAQGFTLGTTTPQTQGISAPMLSNVDLVITAARARGLWVYLTALNGDEMYQDPPALLSYFKNLLNDPSELQAYLTNVVAPTLQLLNAHQDNVFGLDMINEIEAPIQKGVFDDPINGPHTFMQTMRAFIKTQSPWLKVTSTAGWGTAATDVSTGLFSGVGLDFYDLHEYADSGDYAGATAVCDRAQQDGVFVILGEFGQSSQTIDDTIQADATYNFVSTAKSMCFKAAIAWRYDYSALPTSNWFNYIRADGSFRPAVALIQEQL